MNFLGHVAYQGGTMTAIVDSQAFEMVSSDVSELIRSHLPLLADQIKKAAGDTKRKGSVVITIDMIDDPGTDKRPAKTELAVSAKTTLPTEALDRRKVVWEAGQMTLL